MAKVKSGQSWITGKKVTGWDKAANTARSKADAKRRSAASRSSGGGGGSGS